jgi:hypothetical protein
MNVKIERIPYQGLRNDEFPTVYGQTVGIGEKYDLEHLHLEKSFGELLSFRQNIEGLTVYLRKNKKLTQAGGYDMERDTLANTLNRVVRDFSMVEMPEIRSHHDVLAALLEKHQFKTVATDSRAAETERLLRFESDVTGNEAVQTALTALGLMPVAVQLFVVNRKYDEIFRDYIAEKSETQQINVVALRRAASKAMIQFLDAVQYSAYLYEELDYTPLVNELRQLNLYYIQQLKARAVRRKNGKKIEEEPSIEPMDNSK